MPTLFGIRNCDTVKKARRWLDQNAIEYGFHDYRSDGLELDTLKEWVLQTDWNTLLNRRSTTWKNLSKDARDSLNETLALKIMQEQPTIIKRPILCLDKHIQVGFSEQEYAKLFSQ